MNSKNEYRKSRRSITKHSFCLLVLFVVSSIGACTAKSAKPGNGGEPLYHGKPQTGLETAVITITGQNKVFLEVELARTETEHAAGLMYRTELEDGKGMLFIFEKDEVRSFWMKNTLIPLSIAYISYDGKIIDIRDMHPHDTNPVRSSRSVRYALEVPHGWFSRAGIKTGDMVENF